MNTMAKSSMMEGFADGWGKEAPLRCLVLDLNSFFASCEQQENEKLRDRPVAVLPTMAETTSVIAASVQAKKYGVKTGTRVSDARILCPSIVFVQARPKRYVEYHHKIIEAIEKIIPVEEVMSIDEVCCRLAPSEQNAESARALSRRIKTMVASDAGDYLTSSVGVAANVLLAKLASDMEKPDGFTVLEQADLPARIAHLPLQALPGVGPNMALRLQEAGITTIPRLFAAEPGLLRRIWGGVGGARFHALLHGADVPRIKTRRSSICHQHVLAPNVRNVDAAWPILRQLLVRAALRLREDGFFARRMVVEAKWTQNLGYWADENAFQETQDTGFLLKVLETMWRRVPRRTPLRIGVTLAGLVEEARHQPDLFDKKPKKRVNDKELSGAIDALNLKFGRGTLHYGEVPEDLRRMTSKIAFSRVPKLNEF
jgi:DNA polymerase-4